MGAVGDALLSKEHDAEERGLQEKRGEHLVTQQGARNVPGALHKARPVGAELKAHGNARHNAQREGERIHLDPKVVGVLPVQVAGLGEAHAKEQQKPPEPDRDSRKQDMKRDVRRKLDAREDKRVEFHGAPFLVAAKYTELGRQTTTFGHGFWSCAPFVRFMGFCWGIHGGFAKAQGPCPDPRAVIACERRYSSQLRHACIKIVSTVVR